MKLSNKLQYTVNRDLRALIEAISLSDKIIQLHILKK
jgi:hypothetical protein